MLLSVTTRNLLWETSFVSDFWFFNMIEEDPILNCVTHFLLIANNSIFPTADYTNEEILVDLMK